MIVLSINQPQNTRLTNQDGTDSEFSVQDLINALCDVLDGEDVHDIKNMTGMSPEECERIDALRNTVKHHWAYQDGTKVVG